MKNWKYYILTLMTALVCGSCSDDVEGEPQTVDFCVRAAWQDGLHHGGASRALSATDILAAGTDAIDIRPDDYPATIDALCSDGTSFVLTRGASHCTDHSDYWNYTPSEIYKDNIIDRNDLTFSFTATIDDGDVLEGSADKESLDGQHLLLTLHHTQALLRFAFKVDARYDKVRHIRVTGLNLNGTDCFVKDAVLNKDDMTLIAYAYVDPEVVTTAYENTVLCTYNIYDKDARFPTEGMTAGEKAAAETELLKHLDRSGIVAKNQFVLGSLKDGGGNAVAKIRAGYYYDLRVTLNPDYLYVLSDHDNKQMTIE